MNTGTLEWGFVGRGGKTKSDRESSPAKKYAVGGLNLREEWGPTC